jgi:hypothetical protein
MAEGKAETSRVEDPRRWEVVFLEDGAATFTPDSSRN